MEFQKHFSSLTTKKRERWYHFKSYSDSYGGEKLELFIQTSTSGRILIDGEVYEHTLGAICRNKGKRSL